MICIMSIKFDPCLGMLVNASDNRFYDYLIQKNHCTRNDHKFCSKFLYKHIIKMNTKTIRELRSIAKDKDIHDYCKLKKDDLVALLLEQSAEKCLRQHRGARGRKVGLCVP